MKMKKMMEQNKTFNLILYLYHLFYNAKKITSYCYRHKRAIDGHHGNCGLDKYKNWMTSQSEAVNDEPVSDLRPC